MVFKPVLRPTHLLARRLLAGHAVCGVAQGAARGFLQVVDPGIGTRELSRRFPIRVHAPRLQTRECRFIFQPCHLHVAESVIGEARFQRALALPVQNEFVSLVAASRMAMRVRFMVQRAVRLERHVVFERDLLPGFSCGLEAGPTGKIYPQVEHVNSRFRLVQFDWFPRFRDAEGRLHLGAQAPFRRRHLRSGLPLGIGVVGLVPMRHLEPRVVRFTGADAVKDQWPRRPFPRGVRSHRLVTAVGVIQINVDQQLGRLPPRRGVQRSLRSRRCPGLPQRAGGEASATYWGPFWEILPAGRGLIQRRDPPPPAEVRKCPVSMQRPSRRVSRPSPKCCSQEHRRPRALSKAGFRRKSMTS